METALLSAEKFPEMRVSGERLLNALARRIMRPLKGAKTQLESSVAINAMLHALALLPSDFESGQDPYLSVAASPAIFRQKTTRSPESLDITAGLSREHCLGSTAAAPGRHPSPSDCDLEDMAPTFANES